MIEIYHNSRCSKSREALSYLQENGHSYKIIEYIKKGLDSKTIKGLLKKLDITAVELVRKNEKLWKENFADNTFTEDQIVEILVLHPKLIQRPIIAHKEKACIARPLENINTIV